MELEIQSETGDEDQPEVELEPENNTELEGMFFVNMRCVLKRSAWLNAFYRITFLKNVSKYEFGCQDKMVSCCFCILQGFPALAKAVIYTCKNYGKFSL